jgi:hypothetical protein
MRRQASAQQITERSKQRWLFAEANPSRGRAAQAALMVVLSDPLTTQTQVVFNALPVRFVFRLVESFRYAGFNSFSQPMNPTGKLVVGQSVQIA